MIHTVCERAEAILDAAGGPLVPARRPHAGRGVGAEIERAWTFARTTHRPVFTLVNLMGG